MCARSRKRWAPPMCSKAACAAPATSCASPCSSSPPTPACTSGRDSFDHLPIGDIFQIEDTVSRAVAETLHLELSAETAEIWAQRQPQKMEAHEFYLIGRARQSRRTAEDNLKSIEYFRRAVEADPEYVPGAGRAGGVAAQRPVAESRADRRREGRSGAAHQSRREGQSEPSRGAGGERLAAQRGIPLRRSAAAAAARHEAESQRCVEPSLPRRPVRPARRTRDGAETLFGVRAPRPDGFHLARVPLHGARGSRRIRRSVAPPARARANSIRPTCGGRWPPRGSRARRARPPKRSSGSTRRASCTRTMRPWPIRRSSCCWRRENSPKPARVMRELPADGELLLAGARIEHRLRGGRQRSPQGVDGSSTT